mmetsp:Transcript_59114/g.92003  ORF Transcript_59114/g.92003 Transcript_59114/m.92003 type:complete len:154 (+) Transcript_59114:112-573(+)
MEAPNTTQLMRASDGELDLANKVPCRIKRHIVLSFSFSLWHCKVPSHKELRKKLTCQHAAPTVIQKKWKVSYRVYDRLFDYKSDSNQFSIRIELILKNISSSIRQPSSIKNEKWNRQLVVKLASQRQYIQTYDQNATKTTQPGKKEKVHTPRE